MDKRKRTSNEYEPFCHYLRKKGLSPSTIAVYANAVRQYSSLYPCIDIGSLQNYKRFLLARYAANTVNVRIYGINSYLEFLRHEAENGGAAGALPSGGRDDGAAGASVSHSGSRDDGAAAFQPLDPLPAADYRLPAVRTKSTSFLDSVISQEDYEHLKSSLKRDQNMFWYFIVRFLASTGARVSELLQIRLEYLRFGYMDLYSKGGKVRRVYFPRELCQEALSWFQARGIQSGYIFLNRSHRPLTPRGVRSQLKELARRYDIDPETVYPHSFRHRFAQNFLSRFNDISLLADLMGHESIETTRIYLTKSSREQKQVIDQIVTW